LPEQRTEPLAKLQNARIQKTLDGITGFGQDAPVGGEARPLDRKHKTLGHGGRPLAKTFRLL